MDFLAGLARQRSLVIGSTERGALRVSRSISSGVPVASLAEGSGPVISVTAGFSPQDYFSHITGIEPSLAGGALGGDQYTERNTRLTGVIRPHTFDVPDTVGASGADATRAKLGRMFGNMATYRVAVGTWRDPSGALWAPNTIVSLHAPGAMVYTPYHMVVRAVEFNASRTGRAATLQLVLPGSFSAGVPESLPWD